MNFIIKFKNIEFGLVNVGLVLLFSLFASASQAQTTNDWSLQAEKNGVKLYSLSSSCEGKNMLFLKVENTNLEEKHVNYNIVVESPGHNMPLRPQTLELKGSETKTGSCEGSAELSVDIKDITTFNLVVVMRVN